MSSKENLSWAVQRLAQLNGDSLDGLRLSASVASIDATKPPSVQLDTVCAAMGFATPQYFDVPDRAHLPMICFTPEHGWGVVVDQDPVGNWTVTLQGAEVALSSLDIRGCIALVWLPVDSSGSMHAVEPENADAAVSFATQINRTLRLYRPSLIEAGLATAFMGVLALASSMFSMQVYDRVIPTKSEYTLIILSLGVLLSILIELAMKYARSHIMDYITVGMDSRLSREVFQRLLLLRVDQMPASVGSLANQMRGYEQVRNFYTASTLFTLIDLPMGILFLVIIAIIGSPWVAAVPLVFGIISILIGLSIRKRINQLAIDGAALSNMKTGLLVEAVEGIETIKAGSGGWKFLSRWINITALTIKSDLRMRRATESVGYLSATIQQISYSGLVIVGALVVMDGHMTMGAMIACSILSGRILAPVMALPGLMVQHAHAKAALAGLEKLYELKTDNAGVARPLVPGELKGNYEVVDAKFSYGDNPPALLLPKLQIRAGERIAILGPIGAGKSTLLRLLSGLYHPQEGRVLIDNLDLAHVSRQVVSQKIGYLQQDHRLFQGTLRENLLIGLPDPGDDAIVAAMERTGMSRFVAAHPKGLGRAIMEGGKGLSGGQKQLVAFTRLILCSPGVMLLDEPTATMDDEQERRCLSVLQQEAQAGKTLIIVTHKPNLLPLVDRIIVIAGNAMVLDGPRDAVLQKLYQPAAAPK